MNKIVAYTVSLFFIIPMTGCIQGLSSGVLNGSINKSTDRFHVWENVAVQEAKTGEALAKLEFMASRESKCREFKVPQGYSFSGSDIANMKLAHEFGCSSRKFGDAMETMARGGRSRYAAFATRTKMPKGVIAESIDSLTGAVSEVKDSTALTAYTIASAIRGGTESKVEINSEGGNVDYSKIDTRTKIGDHNERTEIHQDLNKGGQDSRKDYDEQTDNSTCPDGNCGENGDDPVVPDACTEKLYCNERGCFIDDNYICSCDSCLEGHCGNCVPKTLY